MLKSNTDKICSLVDVRNYYYNLNHQRGILAFKILFKSELLIGKKYDII